MDKQRAEKLLDQVFNSGYSHENYEEFILHLLNKVRIGRVNQNSRIGVDDYFKNFVDNFEFFGTYKDPSGKTTDILSIKLARDNSKIRARVKQRDIVARWLKKTGSNCALVAFYDDTEDWRFSFVELEYKTVRTEDGRVRDLQELTLARRLSFLVGKDEPNHTCKKYLLDFIIEDTKLPNLDSIRAAFGIESVSKEFFDRYKDLYKALLDSLEDIVSKDERIKLEFKSKDISSSEFAKKLLGQIVFIYFLQKKGWLGVSKTGKWGSGRKDFLRAIFEKKFGDYDNFFDDVLEPLFYNAFASSERDNDYYRTLDCRIPFLNGGLFEPIGRYDWVSTDITIKNEIFKKIFDTFDEFNFTIKEDEPLEKEVAVDPEMLGKIFESLLENNLRKGYGAFYTPREIVHYMCQETLVNYLDNNSGVARDDIDALVRQGSAVIEIKDYAIPLYKHVDELDQLLADIRVVDPAVGSGAFPVGMLSEIVNARLILGELKNSGKKLTPYQLKRYAIENSLYGVDIDASAVDIAKLRFWLSLVIDEENEDHIDPLPNLEQKIMCGDSLIEKFHNVKLFDDSLIEQKSAIKTRIDEINSQIALLHEEQSKSLFGTDTSATQNKINNLKRELKNLIKEQKSSGDIATVLDGNFESSEAKLRLRELKQLQEKFFNAKYKSEKRELREKIDNLEWRFIEDSLRSEGHGEDAVEEVRLLRKKRSKPFFLWRLYFSDVFSEKGGFDIVIGNPPYIKESENKDAFVRVKDSSEYYKGKCDLWHIFGCKAIDLLRNGGFCSFIAQSNWVTNYGASILREKILNETKIINFIDFGNFKVFRDEERTIGIQTMIYLLKKIKEDDYSVNYSCVLNEKMDYLKLNQFLMGLIDTNWIRYPSRINKNLLNSSCIIFLEENVSTIIKKIKNNKNLFYIDKSETSHGIDILQDFINKKSRKTMILNGVFCEIGDGVFAISKKEINKLELSEKEINEVLRPLYTTKELHKYYGNDQNENWILYINSQKKNELDRYPNIKKHLDLFKPIITSDNKPYGLHRPRDEKFFEGEKLFSQRKCVEPTFTYTHFDCYVTRAFISIQTKRINMKYLTAILNSKLTKFWLYHMGKIQGNLFQIDTDPLIETPIPKIPGEEQRPFVGLVDVILKKKEKGEDTTAEEAEIDKLVYKLYALTDEEIVIIESSK